MLRKKLIEEVRTQGELISFNPFKEMEQKKYNEKHQAKQKALMENTPKRYRRETDTYKT